MELIIWGIFAIVIIIFIVRKAMINDFERAHGPYWAYENELEWRRNKKDEKNVYPNKDEFNKKVAEVENILLENIKPLANSIKYDNMTPYQKEYISKRIQEIPIMLVKYKLLPRIICGKRQYIQFESLERLDYKTEFYYYLMDLLGHADKEEKNIIESKIKEENYNRYFKTEEN